jgi:S1-C subfamily serine protease
MGGVFRILSEEGREKGTCFLHNSGLLITAAHTVSGLNRLVAATENLVSTRCTVFARDENHDLALLHPDKKIAAPAFKLSTDQHTKLGDQVFTWGFPRGHPDHVPVLSSGQLLPKFLVSKADRSLVVCRMFNAATGPGYSGAPLIHKSSDTVVGVVTSTMQPGAEAVREILSTLRSDRSGYSDADRRSDAPPDPALQMAQRIEGQLNHPNLQVAVATTSDDLIAFLAGNGVIL